MILSARTSGPQVCNDPKSYHFLLQRIKDHTMSCLRVDIFNNISDFAKSVSGHPLPQEICVRYILTLVRLIYFNQQLQTSQLICFI